MKLNEFINEQLNNEDFKREWCIPDANEIKTLRLKAGLTQKQLAEKVGIKQEAISRLENNSENATLKTIGKISYALGYVSRLKFTKLK